MRFAVCALALIFFVLVGTSASESFALNLNPKYPSGNSFSSNFNTERFTIICNHPATADKPCSGLDTVFKKFYYETPIEPTFVITCPDNPRTKCITTQQHIVWPTKLDYRGRQYTFEKVKTAAFSTAKRLSIPAEFTYSNQNQAMMIVEDAPYGYPIYRQLTFYYKNEKGSLTVFGNVNLNSGYR